MNNPIRSDRSAKDRDNPVVPNVVERSAERAADRGSMHDNPLVPNAIERPAERAMGGDRGAVADYPGTNDRPGGRPGNTDGAANMARGRVPAGVDDTAHVDLFAREDLDGYRTQWESIQTGFVDQPRDAVEQADALVSQVVTRLTEVFTRERSTLEGQWAKGDNVSTEDLRLALTRYRAFFQRLLSV